MSGAKSHAPVQGVISEVKVKHGDQTEEGSILADFRVLNSTVNKLN